MEKTINIGGRLHNPAVGGAVTGANEIKDDTKGKMQNVINQETDAELVRLDEAKQNNLTFDQSPTENSTNPVTSGGVYSADAALQQAIEAILLLIPSAASALNQLADKSFVNSSIATATATFRGTYNLITDLELTVSATHQQIATALASIVSTADNNDYCFVQIPVSDQSTDIRVTERYKFDGTSWEYEYDLNNSGFTADQWGAINSGITSVLVGKLGGLPTAAELATLFAGKQNTLTFDNTPVAGSDNPVKSSGLYNAFAAINAIIPEGADANNKLVAESRLVAYVTTLINALDATFDLTSADGHVTLRMTQADGVITSVQILTSDIASASALTTLGGRVSTAEADIDALQEAYAALTQSDVVIVEGALPSSGQQQNIIYRQPDQDHTPPQFYSDYMWNGTTWVLMATYMNAIDPRPKKGSQNLVTSGGVFDNMGALDVSELNATENPHTLATYADLSAALAAIPSDYQKGGMSIKFVLTSDNKYIQVRCMADEFTTDISAWQGVDDEPTAGSDNLVKSGGVYGKLGIMLTLGGYIRLDDGQIGGVTSGWKVSDYIPVREGMTYNGYLYTATNAGYIAFYDIFKNFISAIAGSVSGYESKSGTIPSGVAYIRICSYVHVGHPLNRFVIEQYPFLITNSEDNIFTYDSYPNDGFINASGGIAGYNAGWSHSDYIPVVEGSPFNVVGTQQNGQVALWVFYDKIKNIIEIEATEQTGVVSKSGTVPQGAYFVRVCRYSSDANKANFKIEYSTEALIKKKEQQEKDEFLYHSSLIGKPFNFNGKQAAFFGDSVTVGVASNPFGTITECYRKIFSDKAGLQQVSFALSGTSFCEPDDNQNSIKNRVLANINAQSTYDYIFIAGGINDYWQGRPLGNITDNTYQTFYGSLNIICTYLKSVLPNSVQVFFILPLNYSSNDISQVENELDAYREAIYKVAVSSGYNVVDTSKYGFPKEYVENDVFRERVIYDGVHPTEFGHKLYGLSLYSELT